MQDNDSFKTVLSVRNDWSDKLFLDGMKASVIPTAQGFEFCSGPNAGEDASHAVLWTKQSFSGDAKVSFDYTHLDSLSRDSVSVCILYILATGEDRGPCRKDITTWNDKRTVPAMNLYFNHMHLYHISFAAYDRNAEMVEYIRARQYQAGSFSSTALNPDYSADSFFTRGVKTHITAMKSGTELCFKVSDEQKEKTCIWQLDEKNLLREGRIGIRQMGGRKGLFENLQIALKG